ncbi:MAG: hypothetical protein HYU69_15750 [Bacteroidetes bacterium]|nr:hypothetical protein [Bacteroidota bacterium]
MNSSRKRLSAIIVIIASLHFSENVLAQLMETNRHSASGNLAKTDNSKLKENAKQWVHNQPITFLENKGQMMDLDGNTVPFVLFKASAPGVEVFVTEKGLTYNFIKVEKKDAENSSLKALPKKEEEIKIDWARVDMDLKGGDIKRENIVKEGASGWGNYYYLEHCPLGIKEVHAFEKITIKDIYPGIDWILYNSNKDGFKYDFIVHPGADPNQITLLYRSKKELQINADGNIIINTSNGNLTENAPVCFMQENRENVNAKFIKISAQSKSLIETEIGFQLDNYSNTQTLIIDPQLVWATYVGGAGGNSADGFIDIRIDMAGNIYIGGVISSTNFPAKKSAGGYFDGTLAGKWDGWIVKFNSTGAILWATYLGGSGDDGVFGIDLDSSDNICVTGWTTSSAGFPILSLAGAYNQSVFSGPNAAFVAKFNPSTSMIWSTFLGGNSTILGSFMSGYSVEADKLGNIFVIGTTSGTLPTVDPGAGAYYQPANFKNDAFIAKFNSSCLLVWSTYFGGNNNEQYGPQLAADRGCRSLTIDKLGNIYITGATRSDMGFPLKDPGSGAFFQNVFTPGKFFGMTGFIAKFNNSGVLLWSTYFPGSVPRTVTTDSYGNVYIAGQSESGLPTKDPGGGAYYQGTGPNGLDGFISKFNSSGVLKWSTYYTYCQFNGITYDNNCTIYITGETAMTRSSQVSWPAYDPGCSYFAYPPNDWSQIILAFDTIGVRKWATAYNSSTSTDFGTSLVTDKMGCALYVVGEMWGSGGQTVNQGSGAYYQANNASGGTVADDAFILKFTPTPIILSPAFVNPDVCICNGTATVNVTCGMPPYNYTWSNGIQTVNTISTNNTITGLCQGTYTVTVSSSGCPTCIPSKAVSITLTSANCDGPVISVNSASVCPGQCTILISNSIGGTSPYTYFWSTGATTQNINPCPVTTTTYTVIIKDAGGNTSTSTAVVTVNPAVSIITTATNVSCNGGNNGSVTAVAGGSPAFSYNWSNGGTTSQISNLTSQIYSVTVTDSKGCTAISTASIISPPPLSGQFAKGTSACAGCGCKEWVLVNATGGTSPYSYSWPDGYIKRYKNQLCPGIYIVNIKDKNGCSVNIGLNTP